MPLTSIKLLDILQICQSCRSCCVGTDIRLTDSDIERWKREERLDILLSINPLIGGSRQLIKKRHNDDCIFLADDGSCQIHETKPYICQRFPTSLKHAQVFKCKLIGKVPLK
ncbi:TPA: YkgJ family cysteine cluster protein [Candidatus Woesearchaeota archaeon]|nr:YkgJ family cysteine cluster protein [Candidatus Woesearchaeota archaeon]HIH41882.1 YkgJ family cysteine cluster protein [Candidatus Woesearchaeota archaeon]